MFHSLELQQVVNKFKVYTLMAKNVKFVNKMSDVNVPTIGDLAHALEHITVDFGMLQFLDILMLNI